MSFKQFVPAMAIFLAGGAAAHGQAIDSVFVEVYHVLEDSVPGQPPLVTYRIFVDLAPDHRLEMVYGDERNELTITTSTEFFNDKLHGAKYAGRINGNLLDQRPLALDSWLTIGAASNMHWGVPRAMDTDGSVLTCPPYPPHVVLANANGLQRSGPLCVRDGLLKGDTIKDVVNFLFDPGYLAGIRGNILHTMNGAWGVLGGTTGPTKENIILIAQISTTGELAFRLSMQIKPPDGPFIRYVHGNAREGEVLYPGLSLGNMH